VINGNLVTPGTVSINTTGNRMESKVSQNPGGWKPDCAERIRTGIGGGFATTRRMANRANNGPAMAAVGMPMAKPQNRTNPMFA
jgi:hypothetical protein